MVRFIQLTFILLFSLLIVACGGGGGNEPVADTPNQAQSDINPTPTVDTDGDGIPDATDLDDDNDGVADSDDAFPLDANESVDTDGDGIGNNADSDDDNDTIADEQDNCPLVVNESQLNYDRDWQGDACDGDDDNDGVDDELDGFPLDQTASKDFDRDGIRDAHDVFPRDAGNRENFQLKHPGVFLNQELLDALVTSYQAGERDDLYRNMMHYHVDDTAENCQPPTDISVNSGNINQIKEMYVICATAVNRYVNDFILTGNTQAELSAIEIFNKFAAIESYTPNYNSRLAAGIHLGYLYHAADLLRSWGTQWSQTDQDAFSQAAYLFLDDLQHYSTVYAGNWQLAQGWTVMAIAVWLDDKALFLDTVRHFHAGSDDIDHARLSIYLLPNGQNTESTRDQLHAHMGILAVANMAQIAFNQGIDLWEGETYSIGKSFEHFALYNFHNIDDVPFQMHTLAFHPNGSNASYRKTHMSTQERGHYRAVWEMVYSHYKHYRDTEFAAVKAKAAEKLDDPGAGTELYGELYFHDLPGITQTHDPVDSSVTLIRDELERKPLIALNFGGQLVIDAERGVAFGTPSNKYHLQDDSGMKKFSAENVFIANTNFAPLYHSFLYSKNSAPLVIQSSQIPNGNYLVRLHFSELEKDAAGERVFDIYAEGELVADNFDVYAQVGKYSALTLSTMVTVEDEVLQVDLLRHDWDSANSSDHQPFISGIEIIPQP